MAEPLRIMSSIKYIQFLKNNIPSNFLKTIITRLQRRFTGIYIHHTVKIYGDGYFYADKGVHLDEYSILYIGKNSYLKLSRNCRIGRNCHLEIEDGQIIEIHADTSVQARTSIHGDVVIGESTLIAPNCYISSGTHIFAKDRDKTIRQKDLENQTKSSPIVIGDDCWLGVNSVVLPGSIIGNKCVIGANVVHSGTISDGTIVKRNGNNNIVKIEYN